MLWGKNRGKWKKPAVAWNQTQETSGFSRQCSATEPWQPGNHQPSQSSIDYVLHKWYWMPQLPTWQLLSSYVLTFFHFPLFSHLALLFPTWGKMLWTLLRVSHVTRVLGPPVAYPCPQDPPEKSGKGPGHTCIIPYVLCQQTRGVTLKHSFGFCFSDEGQGLAVMLLSADQFCYFCEQG